MMYHHNIEHLNNGHAVVRVLCNRPCYNFMIGYSSSQISVVHHYDNDQGYRMQRMYFVKDVKFPIYKVTSSVYNDGVLSIYVDIDSGVTVLAPPTIMKA